MLISLYGYYYFEDVSEKVNSLKIKLIIKSNDKLSIIDVVGYYNNDSVFKPNVDIEKIVSSVF